VVGVRGPRSRDFLVVEVVTVSTDSDPPPNRFFFLQTLWYR